jgi:hypothetical protein
MNTVIVPSDSPSSRLPERVFLLAAEILREQACTQTAVFVEIDSGVGAMKR